MIEKEKQRAKPSLPESVEDGIGIRLKSAREAKRLSQRDLHNRTGLSRTVLINYEAGRHKPGTRELRLLCDALEISPTYLIYGTEELRPKSLSLADIIIGMGEAGAVPAAMLTPMIGAILGQDDSRNVLNLVEALLKAKSPQDYAGIMEVMQVFSETLAKGKEEGLKVVKSPEAFQLELQKRMSEAMK